MDPHFPQTEPSESSEGADMYFASAQIVQLDDADSVARYPARVVRDAITRQEERWGRSDLLEEPAIGQD